MEYTKNHLDECEPMNPFSLDPGPAPTSFRTSNTKTVDQSSCFGNRHVIPGSGSNEPAMNLDTRETPFCSNLSQRRILLSQIRSFLKPEASEQAANILLDIINIECQTLRGHKIYLLSQEDISNFIFERFKVRSNYLLRKIENTLFRHINEDLRTISLFTEFNITTEMAIKSFIHSEYCPKTAGTNIFFRAGKFTCVNDEMGRSRNSILKEKIFDPKTINQQGQAHGIGLYSTPSIAAARGYLHKGYNKGNPITILAIFIKPDINILSLENDSPFSSFLDQRYPMFKKRIIKDIRHDKCHIENCLYITPAPETRYGYTLIKSPEIIRKVTPYDYSLLTKLHVPFSREEINGYKMTPRPMSAKLQPEYIKHDFIEVNPDSDKLYLPIYRYAARNRFASNREFRDKKCKPKNQEEICKGNYKFFTTIDGINYLIRPSARQYELSRDFSSPVFHVQYKPSKKG
ncbi:hypothetical protein [Endozoicomonas sp. GU-1]|uniref:hypothetical protein n=1 Tax=Endozoicomonas sp. GU-1 TaxID=3009078 RepID=UPI0022B46A1F|nr:hypothetical protein [Endozoicomonas sp. GU-1]WBA79499.1 hypothetical protein O2T12_14020 [Endozoicomonas sp. GU-1]WBA87142.1 hypothetical protein O3276_03600 [Endozoicomonas sp. GU-1]